MSSRFLMCIAVALVVAAIAVGYAGIRIAQQPAPAPAAGVDASGDPVLGEAAEPLPGVEVVVVAKDLRAYHPIVREDLQIERLSLMPPGGFSDPDLLIGRSVGLDTAQGTVLKESHFASGGTVARMIRSDERAIAVPFNPAMGAGGHVSPGDYVDVLLFLPQTEQNADRTMQVAVPALRVLTVGSVLGLTAEGETVQPLSTLTDSASGGANPSSGTLVLAVPETLLTRFALAADVGELRIAVRASEERRLADFHRGAPGASSIQDLNQQLFQFEQLALRPAAPPPAVPVNDTAPPPYQQAPAPAPAPRSPEASESSVAVIRGAVRSLEAP
ncbi:Flp pilus assembly protein CpaB [Vreelandella sp. EE27]